MNGIDQVIQKALSGRRLDRQEALSLAGHDDPAPLLKAAALPSWFPCPLFIWVRPFIAKAVHAADRLSANPC